MPLDSLFLADHSVFASDDHALVDHSAIGAWPIHRPRSMRAIPTALRGSSAAIDVDAAPEEKERSLMEIQRIGLPEKAKLDDLGEACKFDSFTSIFGDASGSAQIPAKGLGTAIEKSALCTEKASDLVLSNIFGQKMDPALGGMGVSLTKAHDIPLGSLSKKAVKATQDSCEDFASFLLRRMEKPGEKPTCPASGEVGGLKFTSRDANHALKSYGLCLDSIGETAALQGCEMGNLQVSGSSAVAHLCKVVEGPIPPGIVCSIM